MDTKKSPRADLNRYVSLFMWLALILVMFVSWRIIELKKPVPATQTAISGPVVTGEEPEADKLIRRQKHRPVKHVKRRVPAVVRKTDNRTPDEDIQWLPDDEDDGDSLWTEQIRTADPEDEPVSIPSEIVERLPVFPGCEKYGHQRAKLKRCIQRKLYRFIRRHFDTENLDAYDLPGRVTVYVQFTVDTHGRVTRVKAKAPYETLEKEAIRVIRQLPAMKPGVQNNRPVPVQFTLPITVQNR